MKLMLKLRIDYINHRIILLNNILKQKWDTLIILKEKIIFLLSTLVYLDEIGVEIERYSEFIVNITPDAKIIDYNTLESMKFIDIQQNDVIFYNGNILCFNYRSKRK